MLCHKGSHQNAMSHNCLHSVCNGDIIMLRVKTGARLASSKVLHISPDVAQYFIYIYITSCYVYLSGQGVRKDVS